MPADVPQVETANVLNLDFGNSPELKSVFSTKDAGAPITLKIKGKIMGKYPEGVKIAIEKIITEGTEYAQEQEIEPSADEPIMATMKKTKREKRDVSDDELLGPHSRPPQTATNSQEPWRTAFA